MRYLNVVYALATEGVGASHLSEVDEQIEKYGLDMIHPKMRERILREQWGTDPALLAGQDELRDLLGGF